MTNKERKKLLVLRGWQYDVPNIYNVRGFTPSGCTNSPDWFIGFWITPACDYHDYLYWVGGTEEDREFADRVFLRIMHHIIEQSWLCQHIKYFRNSRRMLAGTYFGQVTEFGKGYFNYHVG